MSQLPLVTIVTPTFNQAEFLAETIESVLAQTYVAIEYIVINDGSTDLTADVMARYAGRIQAIHQDNIGQSRTINRGHELAKGKYVGYLSSDDVLAPDCIAKLVDILESRPGIVCAFPDSNLIDMRSKVIKQNVCRPFDLTALIVRQECYIGPGAIYRSEAAQAAGGWKPYLKLAPDREFWMRLAAYGEFHFLADALAGYRTHSSSTSYATYSEAASLEYIRVLDEYFEANRDPRMEGLRSEAYGHANFTVARNCLRAGRIGRALHYYAEATRLYPPIRSVGSVYLMARAAWSKPIRQALSWLGSPGRA